MKKKLLASLLIIASIGLFGCSNSSNTKQIVSTPNAPAAIGPYSQAIIYNNLVYTSGQIALDPSTNLLVGSTIEEQTTQVFKNITAILLAANSSLNNVIKTNVYLTDMNNFNKMNEVYSTYFIEGNYPSRSCVEVNELPKSALIEIEVIAYSK